MGGKHKLKWRHAQRRNRMKVIGGVAVVVIAGAVAVAAVLMSRQGLGAAMMVAENDRPEPDSI